MLITETTERGPGYWKAEASGVLRPAVEAYRRGGPMTPEQITVMRGYIRQWIVSSVWDQNPAAGPKEFFWLAGMRFAVDGLTTQDAIRKWIEAADDAGLGPL